ncbi:transporter substrate-binding domain-containing protein [Candidatus Berkiella aquae]|uniref:Amino acid ABC transporter substrate-binding protein n=1 Tax=Candidatus Berkiella aquae TaxID=295108 RepID=A0A0Q9YM21_9GAMM|nr:amino acid ABC transporter substrate-binding protein [Candidatus Berkiella aquae]MCS5710519.1 amino acid ABC transporter substrate-binding protein [Candidatus Berkiella aquae]
MLIFEVQAQPKTVQGGTLQHVQQRGYLTCGVSQGLAGFSTVDDQGHWQGLDVDFCRAVAAATLGDANKVKFVPLSAKQRFTALQSGDIDLLSRNTTWTYLRDTSLGLNFIGIIYYDSQGFIVRKSSKINSAAELDGAIICTNAGTTTELNITDYFKSKGLKFQVLTFEKSDETLAAYEMGRCDAYSTDMSGLAAEQLKLSDASAHIILPEKISKEPFSPMVRQGDDHWNEIVRWTLYALIDAEEMNINQNNVKEKYLNDKNIQVERILGKQPNFANKIGLKEDWVYQVILQVGNYGEIFERNIGQNSPLKIERGLNALWDRGGILYAPPFR